MKDKIIETTVFLIAITGLLVGGIGIGINIGKESVNCQHVIDSTPELIWNDDFESFPAEGGLIRVVKDNEDTIYLENVKP